MIRMMLVYRRVMKRKNKIFSKETDGIAEGILIDEYLYLNTFYKKSKEEMLKIV